jgi:RecB family endonuclease NucS|tara:strand:+ start:181 stop:1080 length:900 start_codon:yes stop_codon:yes gene_type:complete
MDKLLFKKGSQYTRKEVGWILLPKTGRPPKGGVWDTGYVRVDDKLIIFMNIGVPGKTKHDFNNYYDDTNKTIVWYGKSKSHSGQPIFQKLISGEYTPYFFARWDNKNTYFTFLGIGKIVSYKDDTPILDANNNKVETIELKLTIEDSEYIIPNITQDVIDESTIEYKEIKSPFVLEKHLEDFIVQNWSTTSLNEKYNIYEVNGKKQQIPTRSGPLDILALKKDKSEFLIIELKKGRASDEVVGQLKRYMGFVKKEIAKNNEEVKGMIIALEDDLNLQDALYASPDIEFLRYELSFKLKK